MDGYFKTFTNVLVIFSTTTVFSLGLEWLFPKYQSSTNSMDVWIQFFGGFVQFFIFSVGAPATAYFLFEPSVYGPPGMTSSLTFFWGFLFQSNMRAKIMDWFNHGVDPTLYIGSGDASGSGCSSGTCATSSSD